MQHLTVALLVIIVLLQGALLLGLAPRYEARVSDGNELVQVDRWTGRVCVSGHTDEGTFCITPEDWDYLASLPPSSEESGTQKLVEAQEALRSLVADGLLKMVEEERARRGER